VIGYYVHHVGSGHLHRARALATELESIGVAVTGLSSLSRPAGWVGDWLRLPRDDRLADAEAPGARGRLHWAPVGHAGLRARMAQVSAWIERARPALVVCDVSVEIELLARLHGIRVVGVVLPGDRGDPAHLLGLDVADLLVGFWPASARGMLRGAPYEVRDRVLAIGALSRFPPVDVQRDADPDDPRGSRSREAVLLLGSGGHAVSDADVAALRDQTPDWDWTVLGGGVAGPSVPEPWTAISGADVVVTHAGQNALAEVAAARRPAVVLPQARPHDEQVVTGEVLAGGGWPVAVLETWPGQGWAELLDRVSRLDGNRWVDWCDGQAAPRFAEAVQGILRHR
jgi:predicted glycosyltransferase